ncbi:hypothetical protein Dsin_014889 [Dipteronia sinensis]|uniref:Trichome birefringence-like N-terminal domain-containing protein n=1 Tax=Dipteronia sinensis TaxID=43782 RepID=A0AAE0ANX0_9ROSI|nr:hypothetical protein Dsin_014889 [Dipteronia sinensis]
MTLASTPKGSPPMIAFPRSLSTIAVSVGGLAMFLIFASLLLISYPIGSTVRGYFYSVDRKLELPISPVNQTVSDPHPGNNKDNLVVDKNYLSNSGLELDKSSANPLVDDNVNVNDKNFSLSNSGLELDKSSANPLVDDNVNVNDKNFSLSNSGLELDKSSANPLVDDNVNANDKNFSSSESSSPTNEGVAKTGNVSENVETLEAAFSGSANKSAGVDTGSNDTKNQAGSSDDAKMGNSTASKTTKIGSVVSGCDLYHGSWFYDSLGPLYTNNTCPVLTQMQNCQGNGRPDKEYEYWRWKPSQCDLPRFNAKKFLELMKGKTLAFIGDSVARNQMESMLCLLWQVEVPKNRGNRKMQRWYFRSTSVTIIRIWSSWLVRKTNEAFDFAPDGVDKLHLDAPDDKLMEFIPSFDVIVLSSGHWFAKQSVYILNNKIVGGQLWWPDKSRHMKVNNINAFGISVETFLVALASHPNYTGLTIVRSYSPDHYEGGAWNTGGSCTGKQRPLGAGELVKNGFTDCNA